MRHLLGISAFYHDSAAALLREGEIVAAAQEERFTRRKNDESFPVQAVAWCLREAGLAEGDLDAVVFHDKPILKFSRLLETFLAIAPRGFVPFVRTLPGWLGGKLNLRATLREELPGLRPDCRLLFTQHHEAHAASAFLPSPFTSAAILTVDGVGEYATTTLGRGRDGEITPLKELHFPHSLGLLYSAFTAYCGFRVNSGEYKLMGLAPFGEPRFVPAIRDHLLELRDDGSFWLNLEFFDFLAGARMTNGRFHDVFGGPPRRPEEPITQRHCDVARSIQAVTEEMLLGLARHAREVTGEERLCLAGGVALNCVANGRLLREAGFREIWVQPAAGDAGGALGAALAAWHRGHPRTADGRRDRMRGALLGPAYSDAEVQAVLDREGAVYERLPDDDALVDRVAALLAEGRVVGWVQGRMEFGPRALGARSILGDPRSPAMQGVMNLKVKFRESFRPFAPAVLRGRVSECFDLDTDSPYMLLVAPVATRLRLTPAATAQGLDRVKEVRSTLPAVTHLDYSARIQTVAAEEHPLFHRLLARFAELTGCPVLVNTSFNVRGEPIVRTPEDAWRCFMNTEMDHLAVGRCLLDRAKQPAREVRRPVAPGAD
ncbi:MAG TPA: carbamoyltransferase [Verrucomicrobiota bacterium]|nr:carbamoyltransferase [Verrucomicrobiota bacterium]